MTLTGVKVHLKRMPAQPKPGRIVKAKATSATTIAPLKYELLV
jgi:hypothetical protein